MICTLPRFAAKLRFKTSKVLTDIDYAPCQGFVRPNGWSTPRLEPLEGRNGAANQLVWAAAGWLLRSLRLCGDGG